MFCNLKDPKNGLVSGQDGKLESQQNSLLRFEDRKGQQRLAAKYKGKEERRERNERRGREATEENGLISEDGDEEDEGDEDEEEDDEDEDDVKEEYNGDAVAGKPCFCSFDSCSQVPKVEKELFEYIHRYLKQ